MSNHHLVEAIRIVAKNSTPKEADLLHRILRVHDMLLKCDVEDTMNYILMGREV